ncbi:MAG: hypothetical protein IJ302_06800 [Clostridia bacterium]|nr:hypothetical protein [Clostridia bacterium]
MIDIHTHMLPGTDDGAEDLDEALRMAQAAYDSGTEYLVLTPHVNASPECPNYWSRAMFERFHAFRRAVHEANIPLGIGYGAEVFYTDALPGLLSEGKLIPLAGSGCLLIEFAFDVSPQIIRTALSQVSAAGLIPVLAHPERYFLTARDPRAIYDWVQSGCIMQINKDSLLGVFGDAVQNAAMTLLSHGLVHCVASDTHHAAVRTPQLDTVYRMIEKKNGTRDAQILLRENPLRMLHGQPLIRAKTVPF